MSLIDEIFTMPGDDINLIEMSHIYSASDVYGLTTNASNSKTLSVETVGNAFQRFEACFGRFLKKNEIKHKAKSSEYFDSGLDLQHQAIE